MRHFGLLLLSLLLIGGSGCGGGSGSAAPTPTGTDYTVAVSGAKVALSDPNLFLSPYNWAVEGTTSATTIQPGAYLTASFRSANVRLDIDTSSLASVPANATPVLRWQVDNGVIRTHQLAFHDVQISLNDISLSAGAHTCKVWFVASDYRQDRWLKPLEALRITGLTLDADGMTIAPTLLANRILFFGDSITEGARTEAANNTPISDNDATHAFTYTCAAALGGEFGVVATSGQGWTISGAQGSNVPPFPAAWSLEYADKPRVFSPSPDYVVVVHGANDGLSRASASQVQTLVQNWLVAARAAMPTSRLCMVVPFGGFERDAIRQSVQGYKIAHPTDKQVFLIDLNSSAQTDLNGTTGTRNSHSYDDVHPNAATSELLGTQLAAAIQAVAP